MSDERDLNVRPGTLPDGADSDYSGWRFLTWPDSLARGRELWMEYRKHLVAACTERDTLRAELAASRAETSAAAEVLRAVEWKGWDRDPLVSRCPSCAAKRPQHGYGCDLDAVIRGGGS